MKPLIIIFKGVSQTQVKNYGGLAVFLFLLPVLDRIQVSVVVPCVGSHSPAVKPFATTATIYWLQQHQQLLQGGWVSTSLGELGDSPSLDISGSRVGTLWRR